MSPAARRPGCKEGLCNGIQTDHPLHRPGSGPLRAGDTVLLSGVVYTARDQAHKRMIEALDRGEPLPFDLEGSAIYYVGPTPSAR